MSGLKRIIIFLSGIIIILLVSSASLPLISIVSVEKIGDLLYRESFPLTLSLIPLIPKYSPNPNPTLTLTYPPSLEEWEY